VSGLNINISKNMAVCIITPALPCEQVQLLGMTARNNSKHLGIYLGKIIESTVTETLAKLEPQLIKQKILAVSHRHRGGRM
jgi:hypothetical protein